jgi:Domain of Unknown Function (DUF1080)
MTALRGSPLPLALLALLAAGLIACRPGTPAAGTTASGATAAAASTGAATPSGAWQTLFDGTTLTGWHNFKTPGAPPVGWAVIDGEIVRTGQGGDLVTDKQYANFELSLEWKVPPKGNSGIIYRIDPTSEVTYTSGPEMQILDDDGHADGKSPLTSAGADYGLYAAPRGVVKPATQWNRARLLVNGNHVEHWLNDVKVVEYELLSPDWLQRMQASKFKAWAGYGRASRGFIALQDHGDRVAFRNIRIRELP